MVKKDSEDGSDTDLHVSEERSAGELEDDDEEEEFVVTKVVHDTRSLTQKLKDDWKQQIESMEYHYSQATGHFQFVKRVLERRAPGALEDDGGRPTYALCIKLLYQWHADMNFESFMPDDDQPHFLAELREEEGVDKLLKQVKIKIRGKGYTREEKVDLLVESELKDLEALRKEAAGKDQVGRLEDDQVTKSFSEVTLHPPSHPLGLVGIDSARGLFVDHFRFSKDAQPEQPKIKTSWYFRKEVWRRVCKMDGTMEGLQ
jgi:hypothetical protein